jgi:hypothetical protein
LLRYVIKCVRVDSDESAEKHPQLRRTEHGWSLFNNPIELGYTRFVHLLSAGAFGFLLLLFPLELLFPLFGFPLLLLLVLLSLLFVVALAFLSLFLRFGFVRGCHCRGGIGGLFFLYSWIVDGAVVVRAYGESGSYALAEDDDCGLSGCTRRGWLGVRVLFYRIDLVEVPALDGSGPLLPCVPPAVLDLDKIGTGRNLAIDVGGDLDLIAGSRETLVAFSYVRKEGSVVSAATGASDASSGCGVEVGSSRSNGASASER